MTPAGYKKLEAELVNLKEVQRPDVIKAIASAKEHGDLKENGEYHAAKERQGFIEGRIGQIGGLLAQSDVVDVSTLSGTTVKFGATVQLENEDTQALVTYQIVGTEEVDLKVGKISYDSPLARAIMGKTKGDYVEFKTPKGISSYEILRVEYK